MTRRKDGLWQQQMTVVENGRKKQKFFYGKTKQEVLQKIAAYQQAAAVGRSFESVADEWWEQHELRLAENTKKSYRPAKERAKSWFETITVKDVTPPLINQFIKKFAAHSADKTVRTQLMVINLILKHAVESGDVAFNPARDISVPDHLPKRKITSPSSEDIKRVKESWNCTFGMFAYMALYTGMRRGELLALTWDDIDIKNRTITVNKSLYCVRNIPKIKGTKTEASTGAIPILDTLLDKLKPKKGIVFPNSYGGYMSETQFQRQWELYQKESGVTATPHQFRHAYATMLFEAGIPPEEAQALLRHAQLNTTMDIYTDLRAEKRKQIFEKVYNVDIT